MSTALYEPAPFDDAASHGTERPGEPQLKAVGQPGVQVRAASQLPATTITPVGASPQPLRSPVEQFQPATNVALFPTAFVVQRRRDLDRDPFHLQQVEAMKNMTRTIGTAFMEAEIGLRPFMQLSSWLDLELFQKLRHRVERSVNGKYLALQRGEQGSKKVPAIVPLGVRAVRQANGDWETSITIRVGDRARAIAMRLALHRDRWRAIALEVG